MTRTHFFPQDDFRRRAPAFQEPHLSRNLALAELMRRIGRAARAFGGEVAHRVDAAPPGGDGGPSWGMRSADQANGVIGRWRFA